MYRPLIASHYVWHRPIIWVSMLGVMLGLGSIVVVDSIFNGILLEQQRVIRGTKSDIIVQVPFVQMPEGGEAQVGGPLRDSLLELEGVEAAALRSIRFVLLPSDHQLPDVLGIGSLSRGPVLQINGILLEQEHSVSRILDHLAAVEPDLRVPDLDHPFDVPVLGPATWPIILGEDLARELQLKRGDTLELMTFPDLKEVELEDGVEPVIGTFVVAGAFHTGSYEVDLGHAYTRLADLQAFAQVSLAAQVAVKISPGFHEDEVQGAILERYRGLLFEGDVQTWKDVVRIFMGAVENQRTILGVVLFFIVFVAGFNLLVALYMIIADKVKDIGILSAMGASRGGIASIFVSLGMLLSSVGAVVGISLGAWVAAHINDVHDFITEALGIPPIFTEDVYGFREIPSQLDATWMAMYCGIALVSSLLFTVLASWRAGRLDPIECLRREH